MKCTVIGDGGWGTALALALHRNGHDVTVWGPFEDYIKTIRSLGENTKFLTGVQLPDAINWTSDRAAAIEDVEAIVLASPSRFFSSVLQSFAELIPDSIPVVSVTKGIDEETGKRMTETAKHILGCSVAALSGPSHAEEVARDIPTAVLIAAEDHDQALFFQKLFNSERFRIYTSTDICGAELGGALKNVIAVAVGCSDGMGFGDNTKAALITRGLAEMTRLGTALGARKATFSGLSGMGDLIVTCASGHSRNRSVGERLGRGETIEEITASMEQVAEGVWNCKPAYDLAQAAGIDVPIIREVVQMVHHGKSPSKSVIDLLNREPKPEEDPS